MADHRRCPETVENQGTPARCLAERPLEAPSTRSLKELRTRSDRPAPPVDANRACPSKGFFPEITLPQTKTKRDIAILGVSRIVGTRIIRIPQIKLFAASHLIPSPAQNMGRARRCPPISAFETAGGFRVGRISGSS